MSEPSARLYGISIELEPESTQAVSELLFELGVPGVEERSAGTRAQLVVYAGDEQARDEFAQRLQGRLDGLLPSDSCVVRRFSMADPSQEWLRHLGPERLTERFWIAPEGHRGEVPEGALRLLPRAAFGFGEHVTTRLAAREVEAYCSGAPGCEVLDLGSGTGVLSLVAAAAGARLALGIDCDAQTVAAALANARLNGLEERCSFLQGTAPPEGRSFDLVVANIDLGYLTRHAARMRGCLRAGGTLIVTGFLLADANQRTCRHFEDCGLRLEERVWEQEWALLRWRLPCDVPASPRPGSGSPGKP